MLAIEFIMVLVLEEEKKKKNFERYALLNSYDLSRKKILYIGFLFQNGPKNILQTCLRTFKLLISMGVFQRSIRTVNIDFFFF